MSGSPDDFARHFEAQYADYKEDLPLWGSLAVEGGGPVLELGCGPGRLLVPLAVAGHSVVGVDRDPAMLARARKKIPPHLAAKIELVQSDIRHFNLDRTFALALVACNTFAHLTTEEAASSLRSIRRHLAAGGRLALDLPHVDAVWKEDPEQGEEPIVALTEPEADHPLQIYAVERLDQERSAMIVDWTYDELRPDGTVRRSEIHVTYHLRTLETMRALLEAAGFATIEAYGDYDRGPLAPTSERMLIVATAPAN